MDPQLQLDVTKQKLQPVLSNVGPLISPKLDHKPRYNKLSEVVRRVAPDNKQCSLFCGGKKCKYESDAYWGSEHQAVKGIYSHWINDDILAMARPTTYALEKHGTIEQFQKLGIKTLLNLQCRGEHPFCGPDTMGVPLEEFSYNPQTFMDAGVYFYNYGWRDYGVGAAPQILSMVKVMAFALGEGKVAVHCHAGLGRTGAIIACFLIFSQGLPALQAVHYVRAKRSNAIQSRHQLDAVQNFEVYLRKHLCTVFPFTLSFVEYELRRILELNSRTFWNCKVRRDPSESITLEEYLTRQQMVLHGDETRTYRHIPKFLSALFDLINTALREDIFVLEFNLEDDSPDAISLIGNLKTQCISLDDRYVMGVVREHGRDINFLLTLLMAWFASLQYPLLNTKFLRKLLRKRTKSLEDFRLTPGYQQTLSLLATSMDQFQLLKTTNPFQLDVLAERFVNALTHNHPKLTPTKCHYFFGKLISCFSTVSQQRPSFDDGFQHDESIDIDGLEIIDDSDNVNEEALAAVL